MRYVYVVFRGWCICLKMLSQPFQILCNFILRCRVKIVLGPFYKRNCDTSHRCTSFVWPRSPRYFFSSIRPSFLSNCIIPDKYLLSTSEHCVYTLKYSVNTCENMITLTHWPLRDMKVILQAYFQTNLTNWYLEHSMWNWVPQEPRRWYVNIG